ncbi:MAG: DegT/DnrJ/EryC1/StrS family aminotransferase [Verrucomicrobiae bacterium]|nr:DegT/DnrJ/EryC1/StrS family aminotransferase [Verrucomicrobiae bacterium]
MTDSLAIQGGAPLRQEPFPEWPIFGDLEREGLMRALESGHWGGEGPIEAEFSQQFATFCGARHAICVANGSITLELILKALGIGPGDEVIVPALTWLATAWAPLQVGATPVFADISADDWCIDPNDVRKKITSRTKAIIPVHLYSQIAPMTQLLEIAREHRLHLIEDCAHTHGSEWEGQPVGAIGDAGSFSFQSSKGMTAGEGGAVVTNSDHLADLIFGLKNCGRRRIPDSPATFGSNNRMTEFQSAVLIGQLQRLPSLMETRAENINYLREALRTVDGVKVLEPKKEVTRQGMYCLSVAVDDRAFGGMPRDLMVDTLQAEGIPVTPPYDVVYRSTLWKPSEKLWKFAPDKNPRKELGLDAHCPISEQVSLHTGLAFNHRMFLGTKKDMDDIVDAFLKVQKHADDMRWKSLNKKFRLATRKVLGKI